MRRLLNKNKEDAYHKNILFRTHQNEPRICRPTEWDKSRDRIFSIKGWKYAKINLPAPVSVFVKRLTFRYVQHFSAHGWIRRHVRLLARLSISGVIVLKLRTISIFSRSTESIRIIETFSFK